MAAPETGTPSARPLDRVALARTRSRLDRAVQPPWLHVEVARRMAERIGLIKQPPRVVVDWDGRLGGGREALLAACPAARLIEVEPDDAVGAGTTRPWWSPARWSRSGPERRTESTLEDGRADLLWSNMGLHLCADPQALFGRWQRALAVGGFVMFSTLGPASLNSLRATYRRQGWGEPHAPFVDMHDLGDLLVHAGFADPVMDQETLTLNWPDGEALLGELRTLGANLSSVRFAGLRTPRWRDRLLAGLAGGGGRPALEFEIVYGHAFRAPPRAKVDSLTEVPLDQMRAMVRQGRRPV